jgi:hypothetical protein
MSLHIRALLLLCHNLESTFFASSKDETLAGNNSLSTYTCPKGSNHQQLEMCRAVTHCWAHVLVLVLEDVGELLLWLAHQLAHRLPSILNAFYLNSHARQFNNGASLLDWGYECAQQPPAHVLNNAQAWTLLLNAVVDNMFTTAYHLLVMLVTHGRQPHYGHGR